MNKPAISIIAILIIAAGIGAFFAFQIPVFSETSPGKCGDGVCDPAAETAFNCPRDCTSASHRDVPFGFHTGNAFPKDITAHNPNNPLDPEIWGKYEYAHDVGAGWERPGMYAWVPPQKSGVIWQQLTDRIYGTIPATMRIFANIDVRAFTHTRPSSEPQETKNLTTYHPPASSLELFDEKMYVQFVKDLVERYDGDGVGDMPGLKNPVHYWQVDNELPGMPPFDVNSAGQAEKDRWLQTAINNYAHILEITSRAIKSSDPSARVAMAGVAEFPGVEGILRLYYMEVLKRLNGRYIDIFDYHFYGNAGNSWKGMEDEYRMIRQDLDSLGYTNMEIWITETGAYTGRPRDVGGYAKEQTEREQAIDLIRRMVYPLSFGVKRVFWAWGVMDCAASEGPDGHMGLMYNGKGPGNPGYGSKKLSYYAYKKLVEVLEGSDWNNIQTIQESDGIYIYKFTKKSRPVWVAWNDNNAPKRVSIRLGKDTKAVKITESVPKYESGKDVADYKSAFREEIRKDFAESYPPQLEIELGRVPVFIEGR